MTNFFGTKGNDQINQKSFGPLPVPGENYPKIYGLAGEDVITIYRGRAIGGEGNDVLIGLGDTSGISYEGSPNGVLIDIPNGFANDGWAAIDKLIGDFAWVDGSNYSDKLVLGNGDQTCSYWDELLSTNQYDTLDGGLGYDTISLKGSKQDFKFTFNFDDQTRFKIQSKLNDKFILDVSNFEQVKFTDDQSYAVRNLISKDTKLNWAQTITSYKYFDGNRADFRLNYALNGIEVESRDNGKKTLVNYGDTIAFNDLDKISKNINLIKNNISSQIEAYENPNELISLPADFIRTGGQLNSDNGAKIIVAYVNSLEAHIGDESLPSSVYDKNNDRILDLNAPPLPAYIDKTNFNAAYGLFKANFWTPEWEDLLKIKIEKYVVNYGYDGVMLDYLLNPALSSNTYSYADLMTKEIQLIKNLSTWAKERFGNSFQITGNLNNDFFRYSKDISQFVDLAYYQGAFFTTFADGTDPFNNRVNLPNMLKLLNDNNLPLLIQDSIGLGPNVDVTTRELWTSLGLIKGNEDQLLLTDTKFLEYFKFAIDSNAVPLLTEALWGPPWLVHPRFAKVTTNGNGSLGTEYRDWIIGSDRADSIFTSGGNDLIYGGQGNDTINGGDGIDSLLIRSNLADVAFSVKDSTTTIVARSTVSGVDLLQNIERVIFSDTYLAIDLNGNAGTTAKILGAVFGKESVSNKNYVGIGLHFLDSGWTYDNLAGLALDAAGAKTNDQIVSLLWTNVIGTKPTAADKQPFIALLENGMTAGALAHLAADTSFNTTNINLVGLAQTGIEYMQVS
jgi:hypothetical protein